MGDIKDNRLRFLDSEGVKSEILSNQQKEIKQLYQDIADDTQKAISNLSKNENISNIVKRTELNRVLKETTAKINDSAITKESIYTKNMTIMSESVVKENGKFIELFGLNAKDPYMYIPDDIVKSIKLGRLYQKDWTLTKAIWGDNQKQLADINSIVAKGLAQGKSSFDIAKDLQTYVDPSAAKPWDWNKVYPGVSKQIDYNAQRLARTMTHHAYQQSIIETNKKNPWQQGIMWLSAMSTRSCALCMSRNEKIFDIDKIPLDHPNGLCVFEVATKPLEDIQFQLSKWVDGGRGKTNDKIDEWAESFNYKKSGIIKPSTTTKPAKTNTAKSVVKPITKPVKPAVVKPAKKVVKADKETTAKSVLNKRIEKNFEKSKKKYKEYLGEDNWKIFEDRLNKMDPAYKDKFLDAMANLKGEGISRFDSKKGACYYPGRNQINLDVEMLNNTHNKNLRTLFHEVGHAVDNRQNIINKDKFYSSLMSRQEDFVSAMQKDLENMFDSNTDWYTKLKILSWNDNSNSVQDLISAARNMNDFSSKAKSVKIKFGHSDEYWTRGDTYFEASSELFANITAALVDENQMVFINRLLPNSLIEYKKLMGIK
jgi:hypothetical protein